MPDNPFAKYARPSGPVYGAPPKPAPAPSPTEVERVGIERERLRLAENKDAREQRKEQEKQQKADRALSSTADTLRAVLAQIDDVENDAKDSWFGGLGETGWTGWAMRDVPGSAAYGLQRKIDMIDANTAFNRLQQMRQDSPTGGAVGNVSDSDMRLLKSTIASLDPNQSQSDFLAALHKARKAYKKMLSRLDEGAAGDSETTGGHPSDIDAIMKKYGAH